MPTTTPSELLPCEHALLPALQVLAAAEDGGDHASRDAALVAVLREHPFVTVSKSEARAEAGAPVVAGEGLILQSAEHFRTNVRAFNKWLKTHEGKPYAKQAGGPSDDGLYTVSAVLRRCLPRGLSLFTFAAAGSESAGGVEAHVLVRGFRKFTGLTDEDEDEESAAARQNESFLYSQAAAERFAITTKANGENGKFMVHDVKGTPVLFAGSKNTCFAWRGDADVTAAFPAATSQAGAYVPGPRIAAAMQQIWQGWSQEEQKDFCRQAQGCSIMLEFMGTSNEHIFPIDCDFVQFVAVLDAEGLPWPQQRAVELFDAFKMPRVRCEAGIPIAELPGRLAAERAAVDREGVVIYLETARGEAVGLVKCKSDYYVKARRTRQILWSALVEPLLRGDEVDVAVKANGRGQGWAAAEARMRTGMCNLRHVPGCGDHWEQWAAEAVSFVRWWRAKFEAAEAQGKDARERELERAKSKFGSLYRQFREDYRPDPQSSS